MNKTTTTMVALAVAGTAAAVAYGRMKPAGRQQLKADMRNTADDIGDVKKEMCNVTHDVSEMAKNLKNQM